MVAAPETDVADRLKPVWRNIVFSKVGVRHPCRMIYPTEASAKAVADEVEKDLAEKWGEGYTAYVVTLNGDVLWCNYSHAIQVLSSRLEGIFTT